MKYKRLAAAVLAAALWLTGCGGAAAPAAPAGSGAAAQSTADTAVQTAQKDRITEQFTLEKTIQLYEWGSAQKLTIHVPQLVCDGPDAAYLNDELAAMYAADFRQYEDSPEIEPQQDEWSPEIYINWDAYWYGDCVSLVVFRYDGGTDPGYSRGWCFDFATGKQVSVAEMLQRMGLDPDAVQQQMLRQAMQTFDRHMAQGGYYEGLLSGGNLASMRMNTLENNQLEDLCLLLPEQNRLVLRGGCSSTAGSGWRELDVEIPLQAADPQPQTVLTDTYGSASVQLEGTQGTITLRRTPETAAWESDYGIRLEQDRTYPILGIYNEKKLTTYPRTDSCYITDDDEEMLEELTEELEGFLDITSADVDEAVPRTRRTVNREKVTDHHAILPTRSMLQADLDALPKGEQNVLKLIIARTLMAVSKPFRYLETLLTTECAGEEFTAKGKEILEEGWKAVERKVLADILNRKQELTALPNAAENEYGILNAELKEGQTSPPKHFTEDTLLHAMETASADSMPEGVERQGIGTPATRAATIEKLVQKGFLERKGTKKTKVLLPTDKGKALITVMPEEIQSADMTADWEAKLLQIERSEMEPETFMTEIKEMISSLVTTTEAAKGANALMKNKIIGVCPNCGANVVEREKGWFCESNPCRFVLWKDNAFFKRLGKRLDGRMADKLLRDGHVRLKDCKSAKGKTYNATVLLSTEPDGRSKFSLEFEGGC